ncbi:MAG: carbohydrate kinase family protein [Methanobacteriota archaeon]|nr:MAG: carbohydrate kinase family protein [Euryarchaeota archaeon]
MKIGFDPTFVDIMVELRKNDGSLIESLPLPGHHHRNCRTTEIAGGNGVNVGRVLKRLGRDISIVVPLDELFRGLLKKDPYLNWSDVLEISNGGSNRTIALIWKKGEIQLNSVSYSLGMQNWSPEVHEAWISSPIAVFLNWGLNPLAHEWVSCQILSLAGCTHEEIHEFSSSQLIEQAMDIDLASTPPILVDTGLLRDHSHIESLTKLKNKIMGIGNSILVCNEEEAQENLQLGDANLIIHSSNEVIIKSNDLRKRVDVPFLRNGERNFVGAGDAFLAGLIDCLLNDQDPLANSSIIHAINVAQAHILNDFSQINS